MEKNIQNMERAKWGPEKKIPSPEVLWDLAIQYFDWVDKNPLRKNELVKSGDLAGVIVPVPVGRPYTWAGFHVFVFNAGYNTRLDEYKSNRNGTYGEFKEVIKSIDETMRAQKFDGAVTNLFNANIIARDLGLAERTIAETKDITNEIDYEQLDPETLEKIEAARKKPEN